MAEPQNIAKQAYLAYIKAKGFPPSKPTHLVKFSKTTSYPINYTKSKHIPTGIYRRARRKCIINMSSVLPVHETFIFYKTNIGKTAAPWYVLVLHT